MALEKYIAYSRHVSDASGLTTDGFLTATNDATDVKIGTNNPTWESLVAQGLEAGSAYERYKYRKVLKSPFVSWKWSYKEYDPNLKLRPASYTITGPLAAIEAIGICPNTPPIVDLSRLQQEARLAFLLKVRETVSPFKALPFLGELKETVGMLRHPLAGIAKHTRAYERALRRSPQLLKKRVGIVSDGLTDLYLQWTYGVSPLLGDMESIAEAAKKLVSTDPRNIPVSVTRRSETLGLYQEPRVKDYYLGAKFVSSCSKYTKVRVQIKGAVRADVSHPLQGNALPTLGIRLSEFVPTVWELLPYSFLVDYVTNVGDLLGAKAVAIGDLAWYWESDKQTDEFWTFMVPLPWYWPSKPGTSSPFMPTAAKIGYLRFNRHKPGLEVSLLRDFSFTMPSLKQALNSTVLAFSKVRQLTKGI